LALLHTTCSGQDALLRQQVVGRWTIEYGGQWAVAPTLASDGSFYTSYRKIGSGSQTKETIYYGKWEVSSGFLISTITNISGASIVYTNANGECFTNTVSIGHVARYKIVKADARQLILLKEDGETNSLKRIP
jgi:hypothetical protein